MLPTSITDAAGFTVASTIWNSVVDSSPKVSETVLGGVFKLRMAGFKQESGSQGIRKTRSSIVVIAMNIH